MDNNKREKFWNVLKDLHNNDVTSMCMLTGASPRPKTLCRFRPVSERPLQQLQENKLVFPPLTVMTIHLAPIFTLMLTK